MQVTQQAKAKIIRTQINSQPVAMLSITSEEVTATVPLDTIRALLENRFNSLDLSVANRSLWSYVWNNVIEDIEA